MKNVSLKALICQCNIFSKGSLHRTKIELNYLKSVFTNSEWDIE